MIQIRMFSISIIIFVLANASQATTLVYFEENGGGGNPRGLYNFDTDTAVSSLRATVGGTGRYFSMAVRPGNKTVFAVSPNGLNETSLVTININTGVVTPVATLDEPDVLNIAFDPTTGKLYGIQRNTGLFYEINPVSGSLSFIANLTSTTALSITPNGDFYAIEELNDRLYQINPTNGDETLVKSVPAGLQEDAAFASDGYMYVTAFEGTIRSVFSTTAAPTALIGNTGMGNGLLGLIEEPSFAPEPSTFILATLGLLSLGLWRHRRQR